MQRVDPSWKLRSVRENWQLLGGRCCTPDGNPESRTFLGIEFDRCSAALHVAFKGIVVLQYIAAPEAITGRIVRGKRGVEVGFGPAG